MNRIASLLLVAVACMLLAACSLGKLAYSNPAFAYKKAPPALAWMVGDYVDLSGEQKDWLRERVDSAFAWHRVKELPQYEQFCKRMLAEAADGISVDEARGADVELRTYYNRTLEHVIPDLADLLRGLDAEQVAQLEQKFERDNRKMVKEATQGSVEDRVVLRTQEYVDNLEEFVGPLDKGQRQLVQRHASRDDELTTMRLADRKYRQSETLKMIRARASHDEMVAGLRRLLLDSPSWRDATYRKKLAERDENLFSMIAELSSTLSAQQRAHLQERVANFIREIHTLTAQG
jgi:hypothetical protein